MKASIGPFVMYSELDELAGIDVKNKWTEMDGWFDGPPMDPDAEQIPDGDGAYGSEVSYRGARTWSVIGVTYGSSPMEARKQAWRAIAAICPDGTDELFTFEDVDQTEWAWVRLNGRPQVRPFTNNRARFMIPLIAVDPRKYTTTHEASTGLATPTSGLVFPVVYPVDFGSEGSSGTMLTLNPGTTSTWSSFDVNGGAMTGGFTLKNINTGQIVRYDQDVAAGQNISIDMKTGRALIDGQTPTSAFSRREWWTVPRLGSATVLFTANGPTTGTPMAYAHTNAANW